MTNDPLFTTEKWRPRSEKGAETPAAEPPRGNGADRHTAAAPAKPKLLICLGDKPPTPPSHLVAGMLPEIGIGIIGGQYGMAKTFVGVDLSAVVIVGEGDFAGRPVKRKGGVLWLAAEGESEIETRALAAITARGGDGEQAKHPFFRQAIEVPSLVEKDALDRLRAMATEAVERCEGFNCELVMIVIDTMSAAAGFDDENSAGETQKVMTMLAALARETRTLILVIDHYGKVVDTGVRGSSSKSGAADAILACLGDRNPGTGDVKGRKLAVTKMRTAPVGCVIPFELARTADGVTCTVQWSDGEPESSALPAKTPAGDEAWVRPLYKRGGRKLQLRPIEARIMLALFLDHSPLFVAGEIAIGLSLALFIGAFVAARAPDRAENSG